MGEQYYFAHAGARAGPFSAREMRGLAATGQIVLSDTVWKGEAGQRVLASKVKNLFAVPPPPARTREAGLPNTRLDLAPAQPAQASAPETAVPGPAADPTTVTADEPNVVVGTAPVDPPREGAAPEKPAADATRKKPERPARQKRVASIKGGVLMGQDGVEVKFKKKCGECGHEDASRSTARIVVGSMKVPFFCPKCKRMRSVEMTGIG